MTVKTLRRQLAAAIAMTLVSTVALGSSTYAWFTMNKVVTVEGMEVKTTVGSNLLIAQENNDAYYTTAIDQTRKALLEPSSTIDGLSYWYTVEAAADGAKLDGKSWIAYNEDTAVANSVANKAKYDDDFNVKYTLQESGTEHNFTTSTITMSSTQDGAGYGYIDYDFYIKATSDTAGQKVVMTRCNLLHNDAALGLTDETTPAAVSDLAWRVAVFSQSATQNTAQNTALATTDLVTILKQSDAVNQESGKAVKDATATDTVSNADVKAVIGTITNAGATAYYKVTVRLWLEGEDKTCTSETYAKLTNAYTLDLEFKLEDDDTNAVALIQSDAAWNAVDADPAAGKAPVGP